MNLMAAWASNRYGPNCHYTGTNDLRIAAIVLEQHGILVTRNSMDFAAIPGLQLDNWS